MNELVLAFYKALRDLHPFLKQLVLVGGWVPYVYKTFVWNDIIAMPQFTTDVDFGIPQGCQRSDQSVYQTLSKLHYPERHLRMGRLYPVIPQIQLREKGPAIPIEFLCDVSLDMTEAIQLIGPQIQINALPYFDVVTSEISTIPIKTGSVPLKLKVPTESAFVFHKLITFQLRETPAKAAKDLYYAYYMLRYSPNIGRMLEDMQRHRLGPHWDLVCGGLRTAFASVDAPGPRMVEQEFGPDSLVSDLRQHILDTFLQLLESI